MAQIIFKNNEIATSLEELVVLCDRNWDEAKDYLYLPRRPFSAFLQDLSQETKDYKYRDLAMRANQIVRDNKDRDIGLEKFLQATKLVEDPLPDIHPELVLDSSLSEAHASLKISNLGRGYLYGSLKASKGQLDLEQTEFGVYSKKSIDIEIKLSATASRASKKVGEITIYTNAKERNSQITVKVSLGGPAPTDRQGEARLKTLNERMENYYDENDLTAALSYAEQILRLDPQHPRANELSEEVRKLHADIKSLLRTGREALDSNNLGVALESFQKVSAIEPSNRTALQGLREIRERQMRGALGCVGFVIGLVAAIGVVLWIRHRIDSIWLIVYFGYLTLLFGTSLVGGLLLREHKLQSVLGAFLLLVSQLSVLFATYVMWQRWFLSVILAVTVGYFISRQLRATFCWDLYLEERGNLKRSWRYFEQQMTQRS